MLCMLILHIMDAEAAVPSSENPEISKVVLPA